MIRMTQAVWDEIIVHAQKDAPIEACGYLGNNNGIITVCRPMKNIDESGEHFTLDTEEQFSAVKEMREKGVRLAAVYHSHPETPARPSKEDIRLAHDPTISYVIVSLKDGGKSLNSFLIQDSKVTPEDIEIVEQ